MCWKAAAPAVHPNHGTVRARSARRARFARCRTDCVQRDDPSSGQWGGFRDRDVERAGYERCSRYRRSEVAFRCKRGQGGDLTAQEDFDLRAVTSPLPSCLLGKELRFELAE